MTITGLEKVRTVLEGTAARNTDLASEYVSPKQYIEHNPRAADGVEGLREYIHQVKPDDFLKIVRAFQDGAYVFTHGEGLILGQNIFFDLFRLEEGLIVEHWAFSAKAAPPNQSGHTQTDGPTAAKLSEDEDRNKAIVREYYETIHVAGHHSMIPQYFSGDHCIRHEPGVRDGVRAFEHDLERLVKDRTIDEIKFVLGQGDFVFIAAKGSHKGEPCAYVDLYRVEDGKIAERWGFSDQVPPQKESKNNNGML